MRGDDWKEGMQNEAASVEDARWSRETRFAAAQMKPRSLWFDVLLNGAALVVIPFVVWACWTALVNCRFGIHEAPFGCWVNKRVWAIDGLTLVMLLGFPFALGMLRVRLNTVLLAFALMPIAKSLWPAVMPLLDLQPHTEQVTGHPLNMLDYVRFNWFTVMQIVGSPLLAWLGWSLGWKWISRAAPA